MTVILASVSNNGYATSSDGRIIFAGRVVSESTNKTFSLYGGKIRGAYAGMMSFGRDTIYGAKETRDFIADISKKICPHSIEEYAEFLKSELLVIIQSLSVNEWSVEERRLVIFLTGGKALSDKDYVIYEIIFEPNDQKTNVIAIIKNHGSGNNEFHKLCNSGSSEAFNAALNFLDNYKSKPDLSVEEMIILHDDALTKAIDAAEVNKKETPSSCGGKHFFQPDKDNKMNGVVAYIQETEDGKTMLTFDDVSSEKQLPIYWRKEVLYTSNSYSSAAMESLSLTKEQYAEIGESLIIRLLALDGKIK